MRGTERQAAATNIGGGTSARQAASSVAARKAPLVSERREERLPEKHTVKITTAEAIASRRPSSEVGSTTRPPSQRSSSPRRKQELDPHPAVLNPNLPVPDQPVPQYDEILPCDLPLLPRPEPRVHGRVTQETEVGDPEPDGGELHPPEVQRRWRRDNPPDWANLNVYSRWDDIGAFLVWPCPSYYLSRRIVAWLGLTFLITVAYVFLGLWITFGHDYDANYIARKKGSHVKDMAP